MALLALALPLAACTQERPVMVAPPVDAMPATAQERNEPVVIAGEDESNDPKTEIFPAEGVRVPPRLRAQGPSGPAGDVTLDFADADVKDVVRTVMGDILKVAFQIDPQVQGRVTLKTSAPLRKEDVLSALETALKVNGAAIVYADNVYNIVPATEAQKRTDGFEVSGTARARMPGYGIEIVPLRFIAAAEMKKVLEPMAPAGGIMNIDATRNLLILSGTGPERGAMLDTIRLFDVDYMRGMSYALVRPDHVDVPALAQELSRVFASTRGPGASLLRFVPLSRVNTLLIASPSSALLKDVSRWVARLDVPPRGPGRRIYYYRLQNAKAEDVARALASVYGAGAVDLSSIQAEPEDQPSVDGFETGVDAPPPAAANAPPPAPARSRGEGLRGSDRGPHIAVDQSNNALIVRADGTEYASLERFLREIDVAPDQVMIEATIAEVTLNDELKYGVEWFFKNADQSFKLSRNGTVSNFFPGFAFRYTLPDVDVALSALGTVTDVKVIFSQKLLTLNNKTAMLQVGDQVPIITQTATGVRTATDLTVVNSVQLRDTGILLRVTPRIGKSGTVFVDVRQEVSNAIVTDTSDIDSPTIQQRKIANTIAVQDGDSIVLGGLIRDSQTYGDSGVPFLKDVPVLGKLFGTTNVSGDRTELLVFLRPRIVRNAAAAREMTEELRNGFRGLSDLLETNPVSRRGGASR
ncbi:MAG: secretin N-terminal domain-containing protein [Micropepsaceae bacterium]